LQLGKIPLPIISKIYKKVTKYSKGAMWKICVRSCVEKLFLKGMDMQ
jgi:hypothetical protein